MYTYKKSIRFETHFYFVYTQPSDVADQSDFPGCHSKLKTSRTGTYDLQLPLISTEPVVSSIHTATALYLITLSHFTIYEHNDIYSCCWSRCSTVQAVPQVPLSTLWWL